MASKMVLTRVRRGQNFLFSESSKSAEEKMFQRACSEVSDGPLLQ
jgi:hypothetical protein